MSRLTRFTVCAVVLAAAVTSATEIHLMSPSHPDFAYSRNALVQNLVHEFAHGVSLFINRSIGNNPRWLWEAVAVGFLLAEFIVERGGRGALRGLIVNNGNTQATLGLDVASFEREWHAFVRARYFGSALRSRVPSPS